MSWSNCAGRPYGRCRSRNPPAADHEVRDQLGHTNIKQTNTYLATTVGTRKRAIERLSDYRKSAKGKTA